MKRLTLLLLLISTFCAAQITEDFSDGDLNTDPTWLGDTDNFIVNDDFQLQLNAPDAGSSFLYTELTLEDSVEWDIFFDMDFNPSSSNRLRLYLAIDNIDLAIANGYYLEIGEDGSEDAMKLFSQQGSSNTLLGTGTMAALANDPARARIRVKFAQGEWNIKADYEGGNLLVDDLLVMDNSVDITGNQFFGIECNYTSTRADKFFFDDLEIKTPKPDLDAPTLVEGILTDEQTALFSFDEILADDASSMALLSISPENITAADIIMPQPNQLIINFSEPLTSGIIYTVCLENVADLAGNISTEQCVELFVTVDPEPGDLFINEILFNPNTGGSDFVELINVSDKFISLDRVSIMNSQNEQVELIGSGIIMLGGEILAFTEDPDFVIEDYEPLTPENIIEQDLPAFNVDDGNVSLFVESAQGSELLDIFDYLDDFHFELIDDVKGVSLEKITPTAESNNANSWHSAAEQVRFATPGYANSNLLTAGGSSDMISLPLKTFSPNGDGMEDLFAIAFTLDQPGYLANVNIYDDRGQLVKILSNNVLLNTESFVYWNGVTEEGGLADIGIYVVLVELFNSAGDRQTLKESFVLADFLD
jgi:hypothetical protein